MGQEPWLRDSPTVCGTNTNVPAIAVVRNTVEILDLLPASSLFLKPVISIADPPGKENYSFTNFNTIARLFLSTSCNR